MKHRTCVLLAEDDDAMRGFVAQALVRAGYRVVEVSNGYELSATFKRLEDNSKEVHEFDIIVSDIHMPGTTALEVLAEFRGVARRIPIVLVTAFGSEETHERARKLGAAAVLDKPFELSHLRSLLSDLLLESRKPD